MKEAVTKEDKLNVDWTGKQILDSRKGTKWLMPFLCGPITSLYLTIIIALTDQTTVDGLFS